MLGLWGSSSEVVRAIPSALGSIRFSAETADATVSRSDGCPSGLSLGKFADLRLTLPSQKAMAWQAAASTV